MKGRRKNEERQNIFNTSYFCLLEKNTFSLRQVLKRGQFNFEIPENWIELLWIILKPMNNFSLSIEWNLKFFEFEREKKNLNSEMTFFRRKLNSASAEPGKFFMNLLYLRFFSFPAIFFQPASFYNFGITLWLVLQKLWRRF